MAANDVIICSEDLYLARELIGGARQIADSMGGTVKAFAVGDEDLARRLVAAGVDTVMLTKPIESMPFEGYASALAKAIEGDRPLAVLVGATNRGKGFAAMLAAALETGCSTEVKAVRLEGDEIVCDRMVYGGLAVATEKCAVAPHVMTASKLTFSPVDEEASRTGEIETIDSIAPYAAKVLSIEAKPGDSIDLCAAKSILAFGRGVDKEEDITMIKSLADLLGAELGCTRPIAEDYHWMEKDRYIGLSGKNVKPQLYFSVGSSGQIQQMAGAQDSRIVVSVCKDANASIFGVCDYGIVGDLYEVVPALIDELETLR